MKRYWFYGQMPSSTTLESELTEEQKNIIEKERERVNKKNYKQLWIGYKKNGGWDFMRNGLEVIYIEEDKGNIARKKLLEILKEKYGYVE